MDDDNSSDSEDADDSSTSSPPERAHRRVHAHVQAADDDDGLELHFDADDPECQGGTEPPHNQSREASDISDPTPASDVDDSDTDDDSDTEYRPHGWVPTMLYTEFKRQHFF
eukprot:SAG31_NODE_5923_length_2255_cov_10.354824_1_plen_112_part_00